MRLLLAVDGSDQSCAAARALVHLPPAEQLIVLHALDVPEPTYPMIAPEAGRALRRAVERGMREDGEHVLERISALLPEAGSVSKRLELGTPAEVIVSTAEKEGIDLIVMGARGLSSAREFVLGSVSHRVVMHAPCAVLVVTKPMHSLRRILLAVGGREDAEAAIRFFEKKPFRTPVEVEVLTVLQEGKPAWAEKISDTESLKEMLVRSAQRFVEDVAAKLSLVQCCAIPATRPGAPAPTILQYASEINPDLILMGSHRRKGLSRFLLGSVAHSVLHSLRYPVLIFR